MSPLSLCGVLVKTREMKGLPLDTQMVLVSLQSYTAVSKSKKKDNGVFDMILEEPLLTK